MREVGNVDGIESRGAARKRHEHYGLCVFTEGVTAKEVVVFGERKDGDAYADDDKSAVSGDARVQRKTADFFVLKIEEVAEFCNGEESKAACKHENAGGDVHDGIVAEAFERVGEQRKSYAAERTHSLEYRTKDSVIKFHRLELRKIDGAADEFQNKCKRNDGFEDATSVDAPFLREFREKHGLVAKSRMHAGEQDKRRGCCHDAEPAQLHKDDQEPKSSLAEGRGNVDDGEPGDADGGHGGKERFDKTYGACGGLRQDQKRRSDGDEQQVGKHHQHDGIRLGFRLENVLGQGIRKHLVL